jgi:hypothetical protein
VYNLILIVVNKFIKMAHYILINAIINVAKLAKRGMYASSFKLRGGKDSTKEIVQIVFLL